MVCIARYRPKSKTQSSTVESIAYQVKIRPEISGPSSLRQVPTDMPVPRIEVSKLPSPLPRIQETEVNAYINESINDSVPTNEDYEGIYDMVPSVQDSESPFPPPPPHTPI